MEKVTKNCQYCEKEFQGLSRQVFCCREHALLFYNHKKFPKGSDYVECKICGMRAGDLFNHLSRSHKNITQKEYLGKFNLTYEDLMCETTRKRKSEAVSNAIKSGKIQGFTSINNPSKLPECKNGRNSPFSMNFREYDGMTDEEKIKVIEQLTKTARENQNLRNNNPLKLSYYTARGYSNEDAKKMLKERQSTFSLEKCIKKYGKRNGRKRWKERQNKWQNTLNKLSEKEKQRILIAKASAIKNFMGYSKISQKLFNSIYEKIKDKYAKIYYATLKHDEPIQEMTNNYEYKVLLEDKIHCYFLDFYVEDINKVIEFDGNYWHGEARGNQERDRKREEKLKELGFTQIYHVKETDYYKDPEKVVNDCLKFLNG